MNTKERFDVGLQRTINDLSENRFALESDDLPCSIVSIDDNRAFVTVKFELADKTLPQIKMPVVMAKLVRFPLKIGDKGVARSSNKYLGGVSGLGGGTANYSLVGNLTGLAFEPLGNTEWVSVDPEFFTVLTKISDNKHLTTPTRIHDKSADIIAMIKKIIEVLNTNSSVTNEHIPSTIPIIIDTLDATETNLAEVQ